MPVSVAISNTIKQCKNSALNLEGCGLDDEHIPDIVALIKDMKPPIEYLNISRNNIGVKSVELLVSLPLVNLDISYNHLRDKGLIELLNPNHALSQTLIWLSIGENGLTDAVAQSFFENSKLVYLNLGNNPKMSEAIEAKVYAHVEKNLIKWEQEKAKLEEPSPDERKDLTTCSQEARTAEYLVPRKANPLTTAGTFKSPIDEIKENKEDPLTDSKKTNRPGG